MEWSERIGRRIKLRDLHILLAVAKAGTMGKAAVALAVSQPVVSKAIADLEHALGLRLMDRSPQGIEPTVYGRALLKWSVAAFDDLRQCVKELEYLNDHAAKYESDAMNPWRQDSSPVPSRASCDNIRASSFTSYQRMPSPLSTVSYVSATLNW
jgi:molybdenum-dependent DNA-binding transcriptional regulator ModE